MSCEEICQAFDASTEDCLRYLSSAKENGKKFSLQLPPNSTDTICRIHVDEHLIKGNAQKKCDYWFRRYQQNRQQNYFVEFKGGSGITDAFSQIVSTIAQIRQKHIVLPKESIHGIIVANKVPLIGTQIQIMKEEFRRNHGADFTLKSNELVLILT